MLKIAHYYATNDRCLPVDDVLIMTKYLVMLVKLS